MLKQGLRQDIQCVSPGANWSNTNNLTTTTWYFTNGLHFGSVSQVTHPSGTVETYAYDSVSVAGKLLDRVTHCSGAIGTGENLSDGTKEEEFRDPATQRLVMRMTMDIASQLVTEKAQYAYDAQGHLTNTVYLDGTQTTQNYDCCHLLSTTDRNGIVTTYGYDALDRRISTTRDGVTSLD